MHDARRGWTMRGRRFRASYARSAAGRGYQERERDAICWSEVQEVVDELEKLSSVLAVKEVFERLLIGVFCWCGAVFRKRFPATREFFAGARLVSGLDVSSGFNSIECLSRSGAEVEQRD